MNIPDSVIDPADSVIDPATAATGVWAFVVALKDDDWDHWDTRRQITKYNGCRRPSGRWNLRDMTTGSPVGWGYADDEIVVLEVLHVAERAASDEVVDPLFGRPLLAPMTDDLPEAVTTNLPGPPANCDCLTCQPNPRISLDDDGTLDDFLATDVQSVHFEAVDQSQWYATVNLNDGRVWQLKFGACNGQAKGYAFEEQTEGN